MKVRARDMPTEIEHGREGPSVGKVSLKKLVDLTHGDRERYQTHVFFILPGKT